MTGLDPQRHAIVEITTLITDNDLRIVASGPSLVIGQPQSLLDEMADDVRAMHASSGLLDRIAESNVTLEDAGAQTLAFLRSFIEEAGTAPLCGNSIGTDRRFLAVYLPEIENFLHYRSIDVSTVKELAKRWQPDLYAAAPDKAKTHRALDDIKESIAELRYYRGCGFIDVTSPAGRRPA